MFRQHLKRVFRGGVTRRELKAYIFPFITISFSGFLLIAYLLYPLEWGFNIFNFTISGLGDPERNPWGWWGFSVATWLVALMLVPLLQYNYKRFSWIDPKLAKIGTLFGVLAAGSLVPVGIFPENFAPIYPGTTLRWEDLHVFFTAGGFGGLVIMLSLFLSCYVQVSRRGPSDPLHISLRKVLPPYILLYSSIIVVPIASVAKWILYPEVLGYGPGLTSACFWEWIFLTMLFVAMFWVSLLLPDENPAAGSGKGSVSTPQAS